MIMHKYHPQILPKLQVSRLCPRVSDFYGMTVELGLLERSPNSAISQTTFKETPKTGKSVGLSCFHFQELFSLIIFSIITMSLSHFILSSYREYFI